MFISLLKMESNNICIVVLIGLPAAGKTSFCVEFIANSSKDIVVKSYSYDKLCKDYSSTARKNVLTSITEELEHCLKLNEKFVFLIDDNMYYKSMRQQYLNLARQHQTGFLQLYFDVSMGLALARNSRRVFDRVPDSVIENMHEKIETPKTHVFVINSELSISKEIFVDVEKCIMQCFKDPVKNSVCITEPMDVSKLQSIDLILRKIVNARVAQNRHLAEMYNKVKSVLFRNIKNGYVNISLLSDEDLFQFLNEFFVL